jgi:hypothetical protein
MERVTLLHEKATPRWVSGLTIALRWAVFVGLMTQMLFAHGCHGDEDHELLGIVMRWIEGM